MQSVLAKAKNAKLVSEPFPHIVIENALDASYYTKLAQQFPDISVVNVKGKPLRNNDDCFMGTVDALKSPQVAPDWKDFFRYHTSHEFLLEALQLVSNDAVKLHPSLAGDLAQVDKSQVIVADSGQSGRFHMQCQFGSNSPVIEESSVRSAHIDKPMKIYNALLYCRSDGDDSAGGDLILYRFNKTPGFYGNRAAMPGRIEEVLSVPYQANTLVLFLNSVHSVHGVRPRKPTQHIRRYINFQVEMEQPNFKVPYINPVVAYLERKFAT